MREIKCGIQLYSLRRYLKREKNVADVFNKIKLMGADAVQISSMCDIKPNKLKQIADDSGLEICCTHSPFNRIEEDLHNLAQEHLTYGCNIIGISMMPSYYRHNNFEKIDEFISFLNETSYQLKQYNMQIAYHNHYFEFKNINNERIYDKLIAETDKDVQFILDTYWVRFAGESVKSYIVRLNNRMPVIHLKDYKRVALLPLMKDIGYGTLDIKGIMRLSEKVNCRYALIEKDFSTAPYRAMKKSMDYLKREYLGIISYS